MYSGRAQILFRVGLHDATLSAFKNHFPPGTIFINGVDVSDPNSFQMLAGQKDVEISAPNKDVFDIVHGIANFGYDPWRGMGIMPQELWKQIADWIRSRPEYGLQNNFSAPVSGEMTTATAALQKGSPYPENSEKNAPDHSAPGHHLPDKVNEIYNAIMREHPEYGKEKAMRIAWERSGEKHEKKSKLSRWSVVSLGELQQPSGVGASQDYNPILDGPNPDGLDFEDNANNSQEQEIAFQTWVNFAVDMLNDGDDPELVLAKLADKGCPEPKAILKKALEQPEKDELEAPITDQIGQDPFQAPIATDDQTGEMQDVFRQPPVVQSKIRIVGTSLTGVEIDRWEDMWGQSNVRVALDEGGTIDVSPNAIEEFTQDSPVHPVTQIQEFIDNLPKVEPTRPHIQARIDNLELVRRAVRSTISKVGFSDQVKLMKIDTDAQSEIETLKESLGATISESDVDYLSSRQIYRLHGLDLPGVKRITVSNPDFQKKIAEKAAIFVAELPDEAIIDAEAVAYAAMCYASENNGDVAEFMRLAEEHRVVRMNEFTPVEETTSESTENEGPAEGIYL